MIPRRVILLLNLLFLCNLEVLIADEVPLAILPKGIWQKISREQGQDFLFVAYEESSFIKEKIGNWLPVGVFKVEEDDDIYFRIPELVRKDEKITLVVQLLSQKYKSVLNFEKTYFSQGEDGPIGAVYDNSQSRLVLTVLHERESVRRLLVSPQKSIEEMKSKYSISKARIKWDWSKVNIHRFDQLELSK